MTRGSNGVTYYYDNNYKNLDSIVAPGANYYFTYDEFGSRTSASVGYRSLVAYTYNAGGKLTGLSYGNGASVAYAYDKYGNVSAKYLNGSTSPAYLAYADNTGAVTKAVDTVNGLRYSTVYDSTGRLISSTILNTADGSRKAEFEYDFDLNNNVTKLSTNTSFGADTLSYTYGSDNLLTKTVLPNLVQVNYTHDVLGRLTGSALTASNPISKAYTYLDSSYSGSYTTNLIETETIGDQIYKYTYDNLGNISKIERKGLNAQNYATIAEYSYDYLGQLTQADDYIENRRYKYTYYYGGNIYREKRYALNNGSPTYLGTDEYTYGDGSWGDLLTQYKGQNITYDAIGNPLTYRDGITFTWENGRQLHSYIKNNQTTTFTYDADGMRLGRVVNGTTQYSYLYNGGKLIQETKGSYILDYFYDANGQAVAVRLRSSGDPEGTYYYYIHNSRGDVVGLYNEYGSLYCTYNYDAWGKLLSVRNAINMEITSDTSVALLQSLRYREYVYDTESGLYYLQSRYYDPVTHRFINADGLVSTGTGVLGYNMFAYCENNPVNLNDKSGKSTDYSYSTYSGITYSGYRFSHVPTHQLGYLGQIKKYQEDGKIIPTKSKTIYLYYEEFEPNESVLSNSNYVVVYDQRYNIENPNMKIYNSYKIIDNSIQYDILKALYNYDREYPSKKLWGRSIESMNIEWDAHNDIYGFAPNSHCQHVDLDYYDEGVGYFDFWLRAVRGFIGGEK